MSTEPRPALGGVGNLGLVWGLAGVVGTLGFAVYRLYPLFVEALEFQLGPLHWLFAVLFTLFMLYSEAYRGFYLKFSPCCVARAWHLRQAPRPLLVLLAPIFCMGYIHGSRRRLLKSWILSFAIIGLVLLIRAVPQPWRGLIDLGVMLGLAAGTGTLVFETGRAVKYGPRADPELP